MIVPLIVASLILAASAVPREYGKQFSEFTAQDLCIHPFPLFNNNNNYNNNTNNNGNNSNTMNQLDNCLCTEIYTFKIQIYNYVYINNAFH